MLKRNKPIKRSKPKHWTRDPAETSRIYGPATRREWILSLPCAFHWIAQRYGSSVGHCVGNMQQCHTGKHPMGKKNDYDTIVPGCRHHHVMFDQYKEPFTRDSEPREVVEQYAKVLEDVWQTMHPR